jgi:hypothetical protein
MVMIKVGWREWVSLPQLGLPAIKAKVDTGARTSALHAFRIEEFSDNDVEYARFWIHPIQNNVEIEHMCEARIIDKRQVSDSGGHKEERYVIATDLYIDGVSWPIELTLSNRDKMKFRMLLGRTAMKDRVVVDPTSSYLCRRLSKKSSISLYTENQT